MIYMAIVFICGLIALIPFKFIWDVQSGMYSYFSYKRIIFSGLLLLAIIAICLVVMTAVEIWRWRRLRREK